MAGTVLSPTPPRQSRWAPRDGPKPPDARRAPAEPWRASMTVHDPVTPLRRTPPQIRGAPRLRRGAPNAGGLGAICAGALRTRGVWGPFGAPHDVNRSREAPRLCRGAANVWGSGGHLRAPHDVN